MTTQDLKLKFITLLLENQKLDIEKDILQFDNQILMTEIDEPYINNDNLKLDRLNSINNKRKIAVSSLDFLNELIGTLKEIDNLEDDSF